MKSYSIKLAQKSDINSWMKLIEKVKNNFPGLEVENYKNALIKNIYRGTAICAKDSNKIVGALLFSYISNCLSFLAVHSEYRRKGIASALIEKMLTMLPDNVDISVTTFRKNDKKGKASRALYKKFGFIEDKLVEKHGYPLQKFILHRK